MGTDMDKIAAWRDPQDPEYRRELDAKRRLTDMRADLKHMTGLYVIAVRERDWETLGFGDMEAWRQHILGYTGLTKTARLEIVGALTEIGMSQREIAAATGASTGTVSNDQRDVVLNIEHKDGEATEKPQASARQQAARDREASRRAAIVARSDSPAVVPPVPEPPVVMPGRAPGIGLPEPVAGHVDEITRLKARIAELEARNTKLAHLLSGLGPWQDKPGELLREYDRLRKLASGRAVQAPPGMAGLRPPGYS